MTSHCVFLLHLISWFRNLGLFLLRSDRSSEDLAPLRYESTTQRYQLQRTSAGLVPRCPRKPASSLLLEAFCSAHSPASRRDIWTLGFRFCGLLSALYFPVPWVFLALPLEGIFVFFLAARCCLWDLRGLNPGHDRESAECQGVFSFLRELPSHSREQSAKDCSVPLKERLWYWD